MIEVNDKKSEKDSENKKLLAVFAGLGAVAVTVVTTVLAFTLGGSTRIESNDIEELE